MHRAIDLGGITLAATLGDARADLIDDHRLTGGDLSFEPLLRDGLLVRHQAMPAFVFDSVGNSRGEIVGDRALHRLVSEAADTVEARLRKPVKQLRKIRVGLTGKANNEGRA